ncbi:MAG: hypothetical protein EA351_05705 [Gemmatimonadales bacterium]|nr:MAG: hypothetical protein EA351_05705 [Gemmatimonadales bacterium]
MALARVRARLPARPPARWSGPGIMKVAHLSDLHLGLRVFPKVERGWNLRERDLASIFHTAVQELSRLRPDLVLLSGNLFDRPDPPSTAFLTLTRGIRTLQDLLPGVPILAIAGERDTPRAPADPGPVAVLDALPGVEAASGAPRAVHLKDLGAHVLLVPYRAAVRPPFPQLRPDPSARWNLLLLRGNPGDRPGALTLEPEGWDYVALGGGRSARIWGPEPGRVRTAGSLERLGVDPWRESAVEKGFWVFDLAAGKGEFHPLPARPVIDLAPVRVDDDSDEGTRRLRELLEGLPGGIEGKILRVRLRGPRAGVEESVSPGLLSAIRRRAAHLELQAGPGDERLPERLAERPGEGPVTEAQLVWTPTERETGLESESRLNPGLVAVIGERPEDRLLLSEHFGNPSGDPHPRLLSLRLRYPKSRALPPSAFHPWRAEQSSEPAGTGRDAAAPPTVVRDPERLQALRADWIEAVGDLEAMNLEWVRERQEAESRLTAYRDRARELRGRLRRVEEAGAEAECPTCGRPLAEAHPGFRDALREEWEDVVQDGQWWKRRREQLEQKPDTLRDFDRRVLELQSELERAAEGVFTPGSSSLSTPLDSRRSGDPTTPVGAGSVAASAPPPAMPFGRHDLFGLAGDLLGRITGGRIQALVPAPDTEGWFVRSLTGEVRRPAPSDLPLVSAAMQLAVATDQGVPFIVLRQFAATTDDDEVVSLLQLLGATRLAIPVIVLLTPALAERIPELLVGSIEIQRDDDGRARIRESGSGRPVVTVPATTRGARPPV